MKEGIDKNFDKRADRITKMDDDANMKGAILNAVHRIPPDFYTKHKFKDKHIDEFHENLEARFLKASLTVRPQELRELSVEILRDTMKAAGIEAPGFRDEFREALEEMMRVERHA
ncbi:MAG: hypothetical protein HYS26_02880 [Candidatus Kaiserbacteria bacterium]|nr:MAG: hypothetical protein HYS26_02880 [Candidatus Kaiserbacteria bacterium]